VLGQKKRVTCPVPGCPNATPIHKNHLIDNPDLKHILKGARH
jgi:hypothetical protein